MTIATGYASGCGSILRSPSIRRSGWGTPPSHRLQRPLRHPPELTLLDKALTGIYLLWEVEPHLALGWILSRHPGRFPGAALRMALTFNSTVIGYFAVPMAPPWWASEFERRVDGQVRRVTAEVLRAINREPRPGSPEDHQSSSNPCAAWPSDPFGSALSAAIALAEADRRAGALEFAYTGALGFTLVYAGEHYVMDLLLGAGWPWRSTAPAYCSTTGRSGCWRPRSSQARASNASPGCAAEHGLLKGMGVEIDSVSGGCCGLASSCERHASPQRASAWQLESPPA